jgi:predicted transcriptional regulator
MNGIAEGEYAVMEVLWEHSPLTAAEVGERVRRSEAGASPPSRPCFAPARQGLLSHEEDGRPLPLPPAIRREDYVAEESGRLLDRMFGGKLTPLVAHLPSVIASCRRYRRHRTAAEGAQS